MNADNRQWHVGKEIPIAMMITVMLQTFGVIWWAATLSVKVDNMRDQIHELRSDVSNIRSQMNSLTVASAATAAAAAATAAAAIVQKSR